MLELSKNESNLVDCNMFPKDYDEYDAKKTLI
jgi:hypothetical protein